jgi:hypothetical protein
LTGAAAEAEKSSRAGGQFSSIGFGGKRLALFLLLSAIVSFRFGLASTGGMVKGRVSIAVPVEGAANEKPSHLRMLVVLQKQRSTNMSPQDGLRLLMFILKALLARQRTPRSFTTILSGTAHVCTVVWSDESSNSSLFIYVAGMNGKM